MCVLLYKHCPCSDPYHTEPFKALQDWSDHLDRMSELNKIFPGDHPAYYEPKKPLPLPERRATSLPPIKGYNYTGKRFRVTVSMTKKSKGNKKKSLNMIYTRWYTCTKLQIAFASDPRQNKSRQHHLYK